MRRANVNKIISLNDCNGNSAKEQMTDMYKKVGSYIFNNAERLSSDVGDFCNVIELKIKILPNELVFLEKNIKEYITED